MVPSGWEKVLSQVRVGSRGEQNLQNQGILNFAEFPLISYFLRPQKSMTSLPGLGLGCEQEASL